MQSIKLWFCICTLLTTISFGQLDSAYGFGLALPSADKITKIPYAPRAPLGSEAQLPSKVDLSDKMPPVGNQGTQASCAAFAIVYALKSYQEKKQYEWPFIDNNAVRLDRICSPSFVYNVIKTSTGNIDCRGGVRFEDVFYILKEIGTPWLADFPYDQNDCISRPGSALYNVARKNKISSFVGLIPKDLIQIKYNLLMQKPIIIGFLPDNYFQPDGFSAYSSGLHYTFRPKGFLNPNNYHAMLCVGYDDQKGVFKILNSYGDRWGNSGYMDVPYDVFTKCVMEAYIMNDDYYLPGFVSFENIKSSDSNILNQDSISSSLKKGYFQNLDGMKISLNYLNASENLAVFEIRESNTDTLIQQITFDEIGSQAFSYGGQRVVVSLNEIKNSGGNPWKKAAYFSVNTDNDQDYYRSEILKNIKILESHKLLIERLEKEQEEFK